MDELATDMLKIFSKNTNDYLGFLLDQNGLWCVKIKHLANNTIYVDYFSRVGSKTIPRLSIAEVLKSIPIDFSNFNNVGLSLTVPHKQTCIVKADNALTSKELTSYVLNNFAKQLQNNCESCYVDYQTFKSKTEKVLYGIALNQPQQDFIRRLNSSVKLTRVDSNFCTLVWLCENNIWTDKSLNSRVWAMLYVNGDDWVLSVFNNGIPVFDKLLVAVDSIPIKDVSSQVHQLLALFNFKQPVLTFVCPNLYEEINACWLEKWSSVAVLKRIELPRFIESDKYELTNLALLLSVAAATRAVRGKKWI